MLVETKVEASNQALLFDGHRWCRSWDTRYCLKELKNWSSGCIHRNSRSVCIPMVKTGPRPSDFRNDPYLLGHLWTSSKVYFLFGSFMLCLNWLLNLSWFFFFKNTIFWMYIFCYNLYIRMYSSLNEFFKLSKRCKMKLIYCFSSGYSEGISTIISIDIK